MRREFRSGALWRGLFFLFACGGVLLRPSGAQQAGSVSVAGQPIFLEGGFNSVWVCRPHDAVQNPRQAPPPAGEAADDVLYSLTDDKGRVTRLQIDAELLVPLGGARKLWGKRVLVSGVVADATGKTARVVKIQADSDARHHGNGPRFAPPPPATTLRPGSGNRPKPRAPTFGNTPWVTILARFSDLSNVTPHAAGWYQTLMDSNYPHLGHYWNELSAGQINLTGSKVVGWYNLPHPKSYYADPTAPCGFDLEKIRADATAAADADVYFPDYYGINIILNADFTGSSCGGHWFQTLDGQTRAWGTTWMPLSGQNLSGMGHEMGHGYGLPHSSGPYGKVYDSRWDIMSGGYNNNALDPNYGYTGVHTIAYHKDLLGWIPPARKFVPLAKGSYTIDIERSELPVATNNYLMAQIFIGNSASHFYTVEARRFVGYDNNGIPGECILLHDVDPTRPNAQAFVVDPDNNENPNDAGAMWTPGETFNDAQNGIKVTVNSMSATAFNITITLQDTPAGNIVTNTTDSGPGSLRNAINWANLLPGTTIQFHLPTSDPNYSGGVFTLKPILGLPQITGNGTMVDGTTQAAFAGDTNPAGPEVRLDGSQAGPYVNGLEIAASNGGVRGLAIGNFTENGILLTGPNAANNTITGNYLGTDVTGTAAVPNTWNGIALWAGAHNNTIGGVTAAARNVLSGNGNYGLLLSDAITHDNLVLGNFIGTNAAGTAALPNAFGGVPVVWGTHHNILGGAAAGAGNLISGNKGNGIEIVSPDINGVSPHHNVVQGNRIGTNVTGTAILANTGSGVALWGGSHDNTLGGATSGAGNLISGNLTGIGLQNTDTSNNLIQGNFIGTNAAGTAALSNTYNAIEIWTGAANTVIVGNLLSGNGGAGLIMAGAGVNGGVVQGNRIGTNAAGTAALSNGGPGIALWGGASNNTIGGTSPAERNLLSGNLDSGVSLSDNGTSGNLISGNYIGTNVSGTAAIPNTYYGVALWSGANGNTIGGTTQGAGNLISGNGSVGVSIANKDNNGIAARNNVVQGNFIGVTANGGGALGNGQAGITLRGGASNNVIGGITPGASNRIAFNAYEGVWLGDPDTNGNSVRGNSLYSNGGLGINLAGGSENGFGVTANHLGAATGPNSLQNYPVLSTTTLLEGFSTVKGTLNGLPNTTYAIDLYRNTTADPSGYGEGEDYLTTQNVTTGNDGNASFTLNGAFSGPILSATATNLSTGDTSEFSQTKTMPATVSVSGVVTLDSCVNSVQPVTFTFRTTDGASHFTRTALLDGNGAFSLTGIPKTTYNLAIKGAKWLQKVVPINTSSGNVSNVTTTLLGGDANNDNGVDFDDLTILAIAYNTAVGDLLYDDRADFNCDGQVEFADLTILAINYNLAGDP